MRLFFKNKEKRPDVLLIRFKNSPFQNKWALPGGFVEEDDNLETATKSELKIRNGN